jgi:hypothetical protein
MKNTILFIILTFLITITFNVNSEEEGRAPAIKDPDLSPIDYPTEETDDHDDYQIQEKKSIHNNLNNMTIDKTRIEHEHFEKLSDH